MPSPSAVRITLVYLGNKVFQNTTVMKKGPPKISFKQELPLSGPQPPTLTPREERQRKWDERRAQSLQSPDAWESTESEKEKEEEKPPPHPKKCKNRKPKVVKIKEYKILQPKKRATIRKCSLCSENFSSQKELNDHIAVHHNYKSFYVVIESVARLLGVHNPLKSTNSTMEK